MRIRLRYPASPENARDHGALAVRLAHEEWDTDLDYSPQSLEALDAAIDTLREEGKDGEEAAGITLTESYAMQPAASVCGFYFAHPQARYFALGKVDRDQVLDYHRRKGMDLRAVERWLAPNLDYDPAD